MCVCVPGKRENEKENKKCNVQHVLFAAYVCGANTSQLVQTLQAFDAQHFEGVCVVRLMYACALSECVCT